MSYPQPYIVDPESDIAHSATIILLHGRSSTAEEFASDLFSLQTSGQNHNIRSRFPGFRWVFPDAGRRWCTPMKEERSAWFDTFSLDDLSLRQDLQIPGLRDNIGNVKQIVEAEVQRLHGKADRVILGGFSQGSATALWSLFTGAAVAKGMLGGFIGLGAWMPFTREAKEAVDDRGVEAVGDRTHRLRTIFSAIIGMEPLGSTELVCAGGLQMPVYLGHGKDDAVISVKNSQDLAQIFAAIGSSIELHDGYIGAERDGHWIKVPEQVDDVVEFLKRSLVQD